MPENHKPIPDTLHTVNEALKGFESILEEHELLVSMLDCVKLPKDFGPEKGVYPHVKKHPSLW